MSTSPDGILEAAFDPAWASVRLVVDGGMWPSSVASITITRSVPGVPAIGVRGIDRLPVVGGFFVGSDSEVPLDSAVRYAATGYSEAGAVVKTSSVTVDTSGAACGAWLKVAGHPNLTTHTVLRDVGEVESSTQGGVYDVAGGGGIAVAEVAGVNADRFTLTIGSLTTQQTNAIRAVIEHHRIVLIQSCSHEPFDSGWYFVESAKRALRGQLATIPGRNFTLSLVGTGIPSGAGQGIAGWSWASVMGTYPTWAALMAAEDSWFDLMQGA